VISAAEERFLTPPGGWSVYASDKENGMIRLRNPNASERRPQSRRLSIEFLEARTLLAGNVITTPTGTPDSPGEPAPDLVIEGDAFDNEIMIRKGNAPDEIIVNGLNGTLVNGTNHEWHFQQVERISVALDGGNDVIDTRNLEFSSEFLASLAVDGGNGDDRITMFNTSIDATGDEFGGTVSVLLIGDLATPETGTTTGNDIIDVSNTTLFAEGGEMLAAVLQIFGDGNLGGTITGGNDRISVTNTDIIATNASMGAGAAVQVFGDFNLADGTSAPTSTIGQGNDSISLTSTNIIADAAQGSSTVFVQVIGDFNNASGTGTATIGDFAANTGGDDTISLTNATVAARGANFSSNSVVVDVQGEFNFADVATATATVGSGNDTITVNNFDVNASGTLSDNSAHLGIFGDGNYSGILNFGQIGRGNDAIYVQNVDVSGTGTLNNAATLILFSDDQTGIAEQDPGGTTVGEGTDSVQLSSFLLHADAGGGTSSANVQMHTRKGNDVVDVLNIEVTGFGMSAGSGDDDVTILNSDWAGGNFAMDEGNDLLKMNGNFFANTLADGGPGIDTLDAHGNTGVLVPTNFEFVNMS
jgi:hypothetical protein